MFDLGPSGALSKVTYSGDGTENGLYLLNIILSSAFVLNGVVLLERFSYDPELTTREQNRNNKRTERSDLIGLWNGYKRACLLGWLSERSGLKTFSLRSKRFCTV